MSCDRVRNPQFEIKNPKSRVLIVEDDGLIAAGLQSVLAGLGYAILPVVASGEGAVRPSLEQLARVVAQAIKGRD